MADAPRSLGKPKNIRVPAGLEAEYGVDEVGNVIHKQYGEDPEVVDATVLPSAKGLDRHGSGGQHRSDFDPLGRNIKQNIIVFGPDGMQVVAQTTGREMVAVAEKGPGVQAGDVDVSVEDLTPAEANQLGENAEDLYRGLAGKREKAAAVAAAPVVAPPPQAAPAAPRVSVLHIEEDYVPTKKKKVKKKTKRKKKAAKKSRRVVETPELEEVEEQQDAGEQRSHELPVEVEINAPFGRLSQTFSAVFIDNGNLILCTDKRLVPLYMLPPVEEPIELSVTWAGQTVRCVWANISFTLPHVPVTFMVLLIDGSAVDEQGQPSEGGQYPV